MIRNRPFTSSENIYNPQQLDNEAIYQKKSLRLELEVNELRREKEQLLQQNEQLKASEALRNSRLASADSSNYTKVAQERDELLQDLSDIARANRLLIQENDYLTTKYTHVLELYNKVALQDPTRVSQFSSPAKNVGILSPKTNLSSPIVGVLSAPNNLELKKNAGEALSQVYSNQIQGKTRVPNNDNAVPTQQQQEALSRTLESNRNAIQEKYTSLKGKLVRAQTQSVGKLDSKEQWRSLAEQLQDAFDSVFKLTQEQSELHSKQLNIANTQNSQLVGQINEVESKNQQLEGSLKILNSQLQESVNQDNNDYQIPQYDSSNKYINDQQQIRQDLLSEFYQKKKNNLLSTIAEGSIEESARTTQQNSNQVGREQPITAPQNDYYDQNEQNEYPPSKSSLGKISVDGKKKNKSGSLSQIQKKDSMHSSSSSQISHPRLPNTQQQRLGTSHSIRSNSRSNLGDFQDNKPSIRRGSKGGKSDTSKPGKIDKK